MNYAETSVHEQPPNHQFQRSANSRLRRLVPPAELERLGMTMPKVSALAASAFYCAPGRLHALLRAGADPNEADPDTGKTPLMWLCEMSDEHTRERKRMFRVLVAAGASLAQTDHSQLTAWHYAARSASPAFRRFVRDEYRRRFGRVPSRWFRRGDFP